MQQWQVQFSHPPRPNGDSRTGMEITSQT
uniref:Uncharacterized protein n=1 Tax=Nelumbo nucifera TaxID=4432 RepID=A0A822ZUA0_NELNU|nr:TPA_asm: hypothetical protein HUJ06_018480 [Nelumbo nucifera]